MTRSVALGDDWGAVVDRLIDEAAAKVGIQPDAAELYPVPDKLAFMDPDDPERSLDYLPARDLEGLAGLLLEQHSDLFHSHGDYTIKYLWKREGGTSNGANVLGKCVKAGGMVRYWADADYIVWLAADHLRDGRFSHYAVHAALFHELLHIEPDPDTGKPGIRAHDFEGFLAEMIRYGLWRRDLEAVGEAVRQLPMFGDGGAR